MTKNQNKFLSKFHEAQSKVEGHINQTGSSRFSQTQKVNLPNLDDTNITASTVSASDPIFQGSHSGSQETIKTSKFAYSNFESHLNAVVLARAH